MMLIRPDTEIFIPKFVFVYLQSEFFQSLVKERLAGSTIPHIFQRDMKNLSVPIMEKCEQSKIVSIMEKLDRTTTEIRKSKEIVSKLKKKLANCFLSGELLIPKEDVN
jgi:type I restriction enzyme S subunit